MCCAIAGKLVKVVKSIKISKVDIGRWTVADELGSDVDIGPIRYPWEQWTNGNTWQVWSGEDYVTSTKSFQAYLYQVAVVHGMTVETKVVEHSSTGKEGVVFKFHKTHSKP